MHKEVYPGGEDSYFLIDCIKKVIRDKKIHSALEIGIGSGIVSIELSKLVDNILAVDINPKALETAKKAAENQGAKNIVFTESDLFDKIDGKFDLIFFNPPYLPGNDDLACEGGNRGQEIIERFLSKVKSHLNKGGIAIVILSSINQTESLKKKYNLEEIDRIKLFFESLYCVKLVN